MNKESILFLTKDALGKFDLPTYGNKRWQTPNIDELAKVGTIFQRHYTAAPSSAMSYFSMFTGKYPYESERKDYLPINHPENIGSKFDYLTSLDYDCHIVWDTKWMSIAKPYAECFGKNIHFDCIDDIRQPVGVHQQHKEAIPIDEEKIGVTLERINDHVYNIVKGEQKVFIWMHLPHVLLGRDGYGADIDKFDEIVGLMRKYFDDDNIFISSDHGNMNGTHGKVAYGFDVYESSACIPLITPRIEGFKEVDFPTVNTDIVDMIIERHIKKREFVLCDSMYYGQLNRKLAIIKGNYKYIYNRKTKEEELYDVIYDPNENVNLIEDFFTDPDRHLTCLLREMYYYPYWDEIHEIKTVLKAEFNKIWKVGTFGEQIHAYYLYYAKNLWRPIRTFFNKFGKELVIHK